MNNLPEDIILRILDNIEIQTKIKYISYGDGEQTYSSFYKDDMKYKCCRIFNNYFTNKNKKIFDNFFDNF